VKCYQPSALATQNFTAAGIENGCFLCWLRFTNEKKIISAHPKSLTYNLNISNKQEYFGKNKFTNPFARF